MTIPALPPQPEITQEGNQVHKTKFLIAIGTMGRRSHDRLPTRQSIDTHIKKAPDEKPKQSKNYY
jgi:hypothetical protein